MNILDLHKGKITKKTGTKKKEYFSSCPGCGGDDRFIIWPDQDRWWCRGCEKSGDAIEYLKQFHGMTFVEAKEHLGLNGSGSTRATQKSTRKTSPRKIPSSWREQAELHIDRCHDFLMKSKSRLSWLMEHRGITRETAQHFFLGWNGSDQYFQRDQWGLEAVQNDQGKPKKLWLPAGLVIPTYRDGVIRVRTRTGKAGRKYVVISGSDAKQNFIAPGHKEIILVVESELDCILLWQELRDHATIIATGSAQQFVDDRAIKLLKKAEAILVSMDHDKAGIKSWRKYKDSFSNAYRLPPIRGKDHTEMHLSGVSLEEWLKSGLKVHGIDPDEVGVDHKTVHKAVNSVGENSPPEKVTGKDGKQGVTPWQRQGEKRCGECKYFTPDTTNPISGCGRCNLNGIVHYPFNYRCKHWEG